MCIKSTSDFDNCSGAQSSLLASDATNIGGTIRCTHVGGIGILRMHGKHCDTRVGFLNNSKICIALVLPWPPH